MHRRVTGSTNLDARELAVAGAPHGTLVTALEQIDGRGRQGRRWHAPPGRALLCSLVLREPPPLLSIAAGVAVAELAGARALLKWPNDVLLDGRKVAGLLIEGRPQERWAVLGIGVNVAVALDELPAELRASAGTLGLAADAVEPSLARLLALLERWLDAPAAAVLEAWRSRDALLGNAVSWRGGRGTGAGIDSSGRLLVAHADGRELALDAGEVHLAVLDGG
ncbi:MAG TPA: biotin--[acetyl-CoA-carboxylase] ligase [Solirubrobacteraceae bacterium]|nr:biotin--[acetyl-CoA-carboxylase] ligase [Solirubrobacteraceae bacterium]